MSDASDFFGAAGGGWRSPLLPTALKARGAVAGTSSASALHYPIRTVGTGRAYARIQGVFTTASTAFIWADNGAVVVNVNITTINSTLTISATAWTGGIWYDQVDDLFYFILAGGGTHYLITISRTGTLALIGSDTTANYGVAPSTYSYMERAAHGSGDFVIHTNKNSTNVNSGTGAATDNGTLILTGAVNDIGDTAKYVTADGKAAIGQIRLGTSGNGSSYQQREITFMRGDGLSTVLMDIDTQFLPIGNGTSVANNDIGFLNWDGGILVMQKESVNANFSMSGPRYFNRALFDDWVHAMCDYVGLDGSA